MKNEKEQKDLVAQITDDIKFKKASIDGKILIIEKHLDIVIREFNNSKKTFDHHQKEYLKSAKEFKELVSYVEDVKQRLSSIRFVLLMLKDTPKN